MKERRVMEFKWTERDVELALYIEKIHIIVEKVDKEIFCCIMQIFS